jgi:hypothetical protein
MRKDDESWKTQPVNFRGAQEVKNKGQKLNNNLFAGWVKFAL